MSKSFFAAALFAGLATQAVAADLPRRSPAYAPAPYVGVQTPSSTWSGVYGGLHVGGGVANPRGAARPIGSFRGILVGGQLGYNYQFANGIVAGVEGDLDWTKIDGSKVWSSGGNAVTGAARVKYLAMARGRLGYSVGRMLVFLTGGYAGGQVRMSVDHPLPAPAFAGASSKWHNGYALGAGAEYALTAAVSAKVEYVYASLGSKTYFTQDITNASLRLHQVRAGLNYRF